MVWLAILYQLTPQWDKQWVSLLFWHTQDSIYQVRVWSLSVCPRLSVWLCVAENFSVWLCNCLPVCIFLPLCVSVCMLVWLCFFCVFVCVSFCVSVCVSVCLSAWLPVCLYALRPEKLNHNQSPSGRFVGRFACASWHAHSTSGLTSTATDHHWLIQIWEEWFRGWVWVRDRMIWPFSIWPLCRVWYMELDTPFRLLRRKDTKLDRSVLLNGTIMRPARWHSIKHQKGSPYIIWIS